MPSIIEIYCHHDQRLKLGDSTLTHALSGCVDIPDGLHLRFALLKQAINRSMKCPQAAQRLDFAPAD